MGDNAFMELLDIMTTLSKKNAPEEGTKHHVCPSCQKAGRVKVLDHMVKDPSNGKMVFDPRCAECRHEMREWCSIACRNCARINLWCQPGPKGFGYTAKKGQFLHTVACPHCLNNYINRKGVQIAVPILELKAAECIQKGLDLKHYLSVWLQQLKREHDVSVAATKTQPHT